MIWWLLRIAAIALILVGSWLLSGPRNASTSAAPVDFRGWALVVLGVAYFIAEYRLKLRADQRAARSEAREVELHKRRMDDKN